MEETDTADSFQRNGGVSIARPRAEVTVKRPKGIVPLIRCTEATSVRAPVTMCPVFVMAMGLLAARLATNDRTKKLLMTAERKREREREREREEKEREREREGGEREMSERARQAETDERERESESETDNERESERERKSEHHDL